MTREGFGQLENSLSTIVIYGLFSINFAFARLLRCDKIHLRRKLKAHDFFATTDQPC
jgi:hypothetical protein